MSSRGARLGCMHAKRNELASKKTRDNEFIIHFQSPHSMLTKLRSQSARSDNGPVIPRNAKAKNRYGKDLPRKCSLRNSQYASPR